MIDRYERRAAKLTSLAAFADNSKERCRYEKERRECEQIIQILKNIKEKSDDLKTV